MQNAYYKCILTHCTYFWLLFLQIHWSVELAAMQLHDGKNVKPVCTGGSMFIWSNWFWLMCESGRDLLHLPPPPTQPQVKIQTKYVLHVARQHGIPILYSSSINVMLNFLIGQILTIGVMVLFTLDWVKIKRDPCILSKYQRTTPAWRMT